MITQTVTTPPAKRAFSLVELSIVLVILGLLIGGVLAGQSLIHASELRSITTQYNSYTAAVHSFRDKYFALPGDMTNAESFWGTDSSGCPNGGGSSGVCNGNGDGELSPIINRCESQEFWRHLAKAGLIEGNYTPLTAASCYAPATAGTNIPKLRYPNGAVAIAYLGSITTSGVWPGNAFYTANYGNAFMLGAVNHVNYLPLNALLSTEDAWNIDKKIDDGRPDSGIVYSLIPGVYSASCADSATPGSAAYNLTATGSQCALIIKTGY